MTTGRSLPTFAFRIAWLSLGVAALVFVSMLLLTVMHP
jgi:hypothetical protein